MICDPDTYFIFPQAPYELLVLGLHVGFTLRAKTFSE